MAPKPQLVIKFVSSVRGERVDGRRFGDRALVWNSKKDQLACHRETSGDQSLNVNSTRTFQKKFKTTTHSHIRVSYFLNFIIWNTCIDN